jgi:hypothetical protein
MGSEKVDVPDLIISQPMNLYLHVTNQVDKHDWVFKGDVSTD